MSLYTNDPNYIFGSGVISYYPAQFVDDLTSLYDTGKDIYSLGERIYKRTLPDYFRYIPKRLKLDFGDENQNNQSTDNSNQTNDTSQFLNKPVKVIKQFNPNNQMTSVRYTKLDRNANLKIKNKLKRKAINQDMPYKLLSCFAPPVTISANYKPDFYNEKFGVLAADGLRVISQNKQDMFQIPHMGFDEFGRLFQMGLSAPKSFKMVNNYIDSYGSTTATNMAWIGPNTTVTAQIGNEANPNWWRNENYELLVHSYCTTYKLTNMCEHPIYFEFNEVCPKTVISDRYVAIGTPALSAQTNYQDPLSCMERDIAESNGLNTKFENFDGINVASDNKFPADVGGVDQFEAKALSTRGLSIDNKFLKEFHYKYRVIKKKIVMVTPGNSVDYNLVINGFQRHAKWAHINSTVVVGGVSYTTIPTWLLQTKFLIVRSWVPSHVRATMDDSDATLSFGKGRFTLTAHINAKFRAMPRAMTHVHRQLLNYSRVCMDPDNLVSGAVAPTQGTAIDTGIAEEKMMDIESDAPDTNNPTAGIA